MITLIAISLVFLLEAWLEVIVIELKDDRLLSYSQLNKQEHFRSAVLAGLLIGYACGICFFLEMAPWALPAIIVSRRIWFDFLLSVMRKRPLKTYEGNDWWSHALRRVFGKHGRYRELAAEVVVTLFCIYKTLF